MDNSSQQGKRKKINEFKTYPVPFSLGEVTTNTTFKTNHVSKTSKEEIINQAIQFHLRGNILDAAKYYQRYLKQDTISHS